jgi:hypothetical protein
VEAVAAATAARARRRPALWLAAAGMLLVALGWQILTFNGFPNDHYFHVALARQMLFGDRPVRDFVDAGAPMTYVISAVARWWFGDVSIGELLIVALGVAIGAAATVVAGSWMARSIAVGSGVALLEVLASPRSYSYPKLLLYGIAGCIVVALAAQPSRARVLAAAALTAAAFLMRHDHGLYIGVACAAAIVASAFDFATAVRRLAWLTAGVAVLLAPWAAWVQYYQGLIPYFQTGIAVSRREADISMLRDWPQLQPSAGLNAANSEAWLYYLFYAMPFACLGLAVWRRVTSREQWRGESAAVGALSMLALAVDIGFLRNPLATRLPDAAVPACLLAAWLLGVAFRSQAAALSVKIAVRVIAVAVLVVTTLSVWMVGDVHDKLDEAGAFDDWDHVREHARVLWRVAQRQERDVRKYPSRVSAALVPFYLYLQRCTAPTDRILVSGSYPDVFVLARRGFAAGHIAFRFGYYGSDADQALMLSRMAHESVPFVLLVLDEQPSFEGGFPKVMSHITSAYDVMADLPVEGMQGVRVMVERDRHRTSLDPSTGWPCFSTKAPGPRPQASILSGRAIESSQS